MTADDAATPCPGTQAASAPCEPMPEPAELGSAAQGLADARATSSAEAGAQPPLGEAADGAHAEAQAATLSSNDSFRPALTSSTVHLPCKVKDVEDAARSLSGRSPAEPDAKLTPDADRATKLSRARAEAATAAPEIVAPLMWTCPVCFLEQPAGPRDNIEHCGACGTVHTKAPPLRWICPGCSLEQDVGTFDASCGACGEARPRRQALAARQESTAAAALEQAATTPAGWDTPKVPEQKKASSMPPKKLQPKPPVGPPPAHILAAARRMAAGPDNQADRAYASGLPQGKAPAAEALGGPRKQAPRPAAGLGRWPAAPGAVPLDAAAAAGAAQAFANAAAAAAVAAAAGTARRPGGIEVPVGQAPLVRQVILTRSGVKPVRLRVIPIAGEVNAAEFAPSQLGSYLVPISINHRMKFEDVAQLKPCGVVLLAAALPGDHVHCVEYLSYFQAKARAGIAHLQSVGQDLYVMPPSAVEAVGLLRTASPDARAAAHHSISSAVGLVGVLARSGGWLKDLRSTSGAAAVPNHQDADAAPKEEDGSDTEDSAGPESSNQQAAPTGPAGPEAPLDSAGAAHAKRRRATGEAPSTVAAAKGAVGARQPEATGLQAAAGQPAACKPAAGQPGGGQPVTLKEEATSSKEGAAATSRVKEERPPRKLKAAELKEAMAGQPSLPKPLSCSVFLGDWVDSLGHDVTVLQARVGFEAVFSKRSSDGRGKEFRVKVEQLGARTFACGHYRFDASQSTPTSIVWRDLRRWKELSIWKPAGPRPPGGPGGPAGPAGPAAPAEAPRAAASAPQRRPGPVSGVPAAASFGDAWASEEQRRPAPAGFTPPGTAVGEGWASDEPRPVPRNAAPVPDVGRSEWPPGVFLHPAKAEALHPGFNPLMQHRPPYAPPYHLHPGMHHRPPLHSAPPAGMPPPYGPPGPWGMPGPVGPFGGPLYAPPAPWGMPPAAGLPERPDEGRPRAAKRQRVEDRPGPRRKGRRRARSSSPGSAASSYSSYSGTSSVSREVAAPDDVPEGAGSGSGTGLDPSFQARLTALLDGLGATPEGAREDTEERRLERSTAATMEAEAEDAGRARYNSRAASPGNFGAL